MKFQNSHQFESSLMAWVRARAEVFVLQGCKEPNANNVGQYQLVLGIDQEEKLEYEVGEEVDYDQIRRFTAVGAWSFFGISYDLKNSIHRLNTENPDSMNWPLITLIRPRHVVTISSENEVEIHSPDSKKLYNDILGSVEGSSSQVSVSYESLNHSISPEGHRDKVNYIKDQISEGNLYEMNLCMETTLNGFSCDEPFDLYRRLINVSPTPFSCYVKLGVKHLLCASPERFICREDGRIVSQPIKGTSVRYEDEAQDRDSRLHLANSLKERAEHIMIVDLVRNDLSKVSAPGSVVVDELFGIYGYRQVNQMISTVSGQLEEGVDFVDCLMATYPMGSMTGAPKHITMEFIDEIETTARGWYSGTVGYIKPNGDFDSNVLIRSLFYDSSQSKAKYCVGGAITFDSDPDAEYQECLLKSSAIRKALNINL